TSLIQTIGRAARNVSGQVHMYADNVTTAMRNAVDETNRRREIQLAFNTEHGIDPTPLRKRIGDITDMLAREQIDTQELLAGGYRQAADTKVSPAASERVAPAASDDLAGLIEELSAQMQQAAEELQFEIAARLRDEISDLKKELRQMVEATK